MPKKISKIIIIFVVILFVLYFGRNIIIKNAVTASVKAITGLNLSIDKIQIGIFKTLLAIEGLKLFNPPNFPDKVMVDMPNLYIDYDLGSFFKGVIHLEKMVLNLKEVVVVKNSKGELNLNSLTVIKSQKPAKKEEAQKKPSPMPKIQIDSLDLKIGRVIYKDYSKGGSPIVKEFNVNIDEHFENITNPYLLGSIIVLKSLQNTTIANLANFDIGSLSTNVSEMLKGTSIDKILETGKAIGGDAIQKTATDAATQAVDTIKQILPFGK